MSAPQRTRSQISAKAWKERVEQLVLDMETMRSYEDSYQTTSDHVIAAALVRQSEMTGLIVQELRLMREAMEK